MAATMGMGMGTLINEYEKQLEEKHNYVEPKSVVPPRNKWSIGSRVLETLNGEQSYHLGKMMEEIRKFSQSVLGQNLNISQQMSGMNLNSSTDCNSKQVTESSPENLSALSEEAGTGKTTAIRETIKRLLQRGGVPLLRSTDEHKYLKRGFAGIVCCAFHEQSNE